MPDPKHPTAKLCGECGCIHRPGENTLCPGWRPGPFAPANPSHPTPWQLDPRADDTILDADGTLIAVTHQETAALIVECVNGKGVLDLASDVAANFGKPRSADLEIAFMRAVCDALRSKP